MLQRSFTALATPFKHGEIDWLALDALIERQIEAGSHGLVICGTTAESPTLTGDEHRRIVGRAVEIVKGRIPVMAGTGTNATAKTISLTEEAKNLGADAALVVTPYYNKPTQEGLYAHYRAIAEAVDLPIVIYNIPGRCIVDMSVETMARLANNCPNIIGVKDSTSDFTRPSQMTEKAGPDFSQLSGEDGTALEFLQAGGHGCISVTANITPDLCARMQNAWAEGRYEEAQEIHEKLLPLHKALFLETSPAPLKYAMSVLGLCSDEVRLPMVSPGEACRRAVDVALDGLIADRAVESVNAA